MKRNKIREGVGKVRRIVKLYSGRYAKKQGAIKRHGECKRCGACCKLLFTCPALDYEEGKAMCRYYDKRSKVCKLFPLDGKDIKDRDSVSPNKTCGFYFSQP